MWRKGLVLVIATWAAGGCVEASTVPVSGDTRSEAPRLRVEFRVADMSGDSKSTFSQGETVTFSFVVENVGNEPATIGFTFPPHRVSIETADGGEPVWQAFLGRMFPQVMRQDTIPAGEQRTFEVEWRVDVAPGDYRAIPEFVAFAGSERLRADLQPIRLAVKADGSKRKIEEQ